MKQKYLDISELSIESWVKEFPHKCGRIHKAD